MNYNLMLLRKNEKIIPLLIIYLFLYTIIIRYTININSNNINIYYSLTLDKHILYIFYGFFFILINVVIINNVMDNEFIVRMERKKLLFSLINIGILYSLNFALLSNVLLLIVLKMYNKFWNYEIILYTVVFMTLYGVFLYSIIAIFYLKYRIKSIILVNMVNLLPVTIFSNTQINSYLIVDRLYSNISLVLIILAILFIMNFIVAYFIFEKCDLII